MVQNVLWLVEIAAYAALLLKLRRSGLDRSYPFFFAYLGYRLVQNTALFAVAYQPKTYGWLYFLSQPVAWVLYVLVVLELYSLVLRGYKGIASFGRRVMMGALVFSVLLSAATLPADLANRGEQFPTIVYFTAISRGINASLVIFLLIIAAFLAWYPIPLCRNVIVHTITYAVYFLSTTLSYFVRNITGAGVNVAVNLVLTSVTVGTLAVWILFLTREGEGKTVILHQHWRPADEEQLLGQLSAINATLLRAARK